VGERTMTGALRADGQRRMIGDTMTRKRPNPPRSSATRELNAFSRGQLPSELPSPGPFRPAVWLIRSIHSLAAVLIQYSSKRAAYLVDNHSMRHSYSCHGSRT
jgi:hypothetical protein